MRGVLACAGLWAVALAGPAHAQTLVFGDEIDPIAGGSAPRDDVPQLHPWAEGFTVDGVGYFDATLALATPPPGLPAGCLPEAIGATTCVTAGAGAAWDELRRMSLADGTILDVEPFHARPAYGGGRRMIAANGDDYLFVASSGAMYLLRAGASSSAPEVVPMPCPVCYVDAIACATGRGCVGVVAANWPEGMAELFRIDTGATPGLGSSVPLGTTFTDVVLGTIDGQWLVSRAGAVAFYDDALALLGSVSVHGQAFGCVHDACLAVDGGGVVSRCQSGGCAPFGMLPPMLTGTVPYFVCGTVSCGVLQYGTDARSHLGAVSGTDGHAVDLTEAYWSRAANETSPHAVVTDAGALVVYDDDRDTGTPRAAIVLADAAGPHVPSFLAPSDGSAGPSRVAALVRTSTGATVLRSDRGELPTAWMRLGPDGTIVSERIDAFTCTGIVASGPRGIEMACDARTARAEPSLVPLTDDGRTRGSTHFFPIGTPLALASGELRSLVVDDTGSAVLIGGPADATSDLIAVPAGVVAAGADRFLVVGETDVRTLAAVLLTADGRRTTLADLAPRSTDVYGVSGASVVFDGSTFLVAWIETRDDGTRPLVLRRVRADGVVEDAPHVLVDDVGPEVWSRPSVADLASDGAGRSVIVFTRSVATPDGVSVLASVHAIPISSGAPIGTACLDAATCGSSVCEDGVCCATPCPGERSVCSLAAGAHANGVCELRDLDAGFPTLADAGPDASVRPADAGARTLPPVRGCACHVATHGRSLGALGLGGALALVARWRSTRRRLGRAEVSSRR